MLGEDVLVLHRTQIGETDMGEPLYEWDTQREIVKNVLVRPYNQALAIGELSDPRPEAVKIKYVLAFPKHYTKDLTGARIVLVSRGQDTSPEKALYVLGSPDMVSPCPTSWNRLVEVMTQDG